MPDKESLIRLRAKFTQKYGVELDEFMAIFLQEITEIKTDSLQIAKEFRQLSPRNSWDAFVFGLGKYGIFSVACLLVGLAVYEQVHTQANTIRATERALFLKNNPQAVQFYPFIKNAMLLHKKGGMYVKIHRIKQNEKPKPGQTFEYEKDCDCVYVPINFNE